MDHRIPWKSYFVDDLRQDSQELSIFALVESSPFKLVQNGAVDLRKIIGSKYQSALSLCISPFSDNVEISSISSRILMLVQLLQQPAYYDLVSEAVLGEAWAVHYARAFISVSTW